MAGRKFKKKFKKHFKKRMSKIDKNLDKRIKKIEGDVEHKYIDTTLTAPQVIPEDITPTYWVSYCLNNSQQGLDVTNKRIGTQIVTKYINIRYNVKQSSTVVAGSGDNTVRVVIFWYKNSVSLAPAPNQFFELGGAYSAVNSVFAQYNNQYRDSYKILYDRIHIMKPLDWDGNTTIVPDIYHKNLTLRLGRKVRYVEGVGAGTFADILDNSLWIAVMTGTALNRPSFYMASRVFYTDE